MFSGIIETMGTVEEERKVSGGKYLTITSETVAANLHAGDSIAVDGCCLTAVAVEKKNFTVFLSLETVKTTTLGSMQAGQLVNLERALTYGAAVGGHLVTGHVDTVGRIKSKRAQGESFLYEFTAADEQWQKYVVQRGCIAIDGISLTVTDRDEGSFRVVIIPYTWQHTTLGEKKVGDLVNLELDLLAKYVEGILRGKEQGGLTAEFLRKSGFSV